MIKADVKTTWERRDGPVHAHFGLTYAAYYCVPRLALQAMPVWWQKLFVWLVNMLPDTPGYRCQRQKKNGQFTTDKWANYKHGRIEDLLQEEQHD